MSKLSVVYNKFNRGEIGDNSITRDDVKKVANSATLMRNFSPERLGPMSYRPGMEYHVDVDIETRLVPFVKKIDDKALLAFSDDDLRVIVDDAVVTRTAVTSSITNGTFPTNLSGWTDNSGAGSAVAQFSSGGRTFAKFTGSGSTDASLYQTVTIAGGNIGAEHGLRIIVETGPLRLRLGTTGADSSDITDSTLLPGEHSLVFTPASDVTISFSTFTKYSGWLESVAFEAAGEMVIPTGIATANLDDIRQHQSADVVFLAVDGIKQKRVERRGVKSWSVAGYRADDGPFNAINNASTTLAPAGLSGDTTVTASSAFFETTDVGRLVKISSAGQTVEASVSAEDNGTGSIRVTGVGSSRVFSVVRSGTFSATATLQRSADDTIWEDVTTYSSVGTTSFDDNLDNANLFYRLHVKTGDYTSGTIELSLVYAAGSIDGIARIILPNPTSTVANVQVLKDFGSTSATRDWYMGSWTDGSYPTSTTIYEGRLFFAGSNNIWGSVSDAYTSFDSEVEGDSAPIKRTIGIGPVDKINWLCPTSRLLIGMPTEDLTLRSSSFGEVLTNTNANIKDNSGQGSAPTEFAKAGQSIYFVHHTTTKLIRLFYDSNSDSHADEDLMTMHPEIASVGIRRIAVVRQPETRVFILLTDGSVAVLLHDKAEEVGAWARMTTDGTITDVVSLPGLTEDEIYFVVTRGGVGRLEKLAKFSETKPHDSFQNYSSPGTTITGLSHLEGETVGVWGDGADIGDFIVSGGSITVPANYVDVTVGLRYTADYTSNKLSGYVPYSMTTRRARVVDIALVASNLYGAGLSVGPDSANLRIIEGASGTNYDQDSFPFDGNYQTDSRVHVQATAPCTIKALVYGIRESESKATE